MHKYQKTDDVTFDKYYPQHPLPKEIKDLPEKETVCEFCGISYLIHSEIKRLETEIISLNKRIKFFEDIEITERTFENKCNSLSSKLDQTIINYSSLEENFRSLKDERDLFQTNLTDRDDKIIQLESLVNILKCEKEKFISFQKHFYQQLFDLKRDNRVVKTHLISVKDEINLIFTQNQIQTSVETINIRNNLEQIMEYYRSVALNHQTEIANRDLEIASLQNKIQQKSEQLLKENERLKVLTEKNNKLLHDISVLQHDSNEKDLLISNKDEILRLFHEEKNEITISQKNESLCFKEEIASLKEEVNKREELLNQEKMYNVTLKSELEEANLRFDSVSNKTKDSMKRISSLEDELQQLKQSLKSSRQNQELMDNEIASTTKQIKEQLTKLVSEINSTQHSFEQSKLKMENVFKKQKSIYEEEIGQLKKEVDKQNEIKNKYEKQENENQKLQESISLQINENNELHKKIHVLENKNNVKVQQQIDNERKDKIIQELENEIFVKEKIIDRMEEDLIKNNNEIHSLKVMVQQECDERYELTESLNRAREQLLIIGEINSSKNSICLPPIQHKTSNSSISSFKTNSTQISQKQTINERRNSTNSKTSIHTIISTKRKLEKLFIE